MIEDNDGYGTSERIFRSSGEALLFWSLVSGLFWFGIIKAGIRLFG